MVVFDRALPPPISVLVPSRTTTSAVVRAGTAKRSGTAAPIAPADDCWLFFVPFQIVYLASRPASEVADLTVGSTLDSATVSRVLRLVLAAKLCRTCAPPALARILCAGAARAPSGRFLLAFHLLYRRHRRGSL